LSRVAERKKNAISASGGELTTLTVETMKLIMSAKDFQEGPRAFLRNERLSAQIGNDHAPVTNCDETAFPVLAGFFVYPRLRFG
jgi:hypothetical protein